MKQVFIIFGNHGESPTHLDDHLSYLSELFIYCGFSPAFKKNPVPGSLNVVIENFSGSFLKLIREAAAVPGTRFLCIATEMVTGATFNDFSNPLCAADNQNAKPELGEPRSSRAANPFGAPERVAAYMAEKIRQHRSRKHKSGNPEITKRYEKLRYWQKRYDRFVEASRHFEQVWCVEAAQLPGYETLLADRAKLLPVCSLSPDVIYPLQGELDKDIDVFFSGSLTPYRSAWIQEIQNAGFAVEIGAVSALGALRENLIARSKVCIHLKINENWLYPSIMRLHHLLRSGSVVMSQRAETTCFQESLVTGFGNEKPEAIRTLSEMIEAGDFVSIGRKSCETYYERSAGLRKDAAALLSSLEAQVPAEFPAPPKARVAR